eukprot:GHVR01098565.1.p2 GENE.GHVR01098565.1~~GHVR01098565.1.p2  ORF type:complete len:105 (-),score=7.46 GHVR01098565.1:12-326(-)
MLPRGTERIINVLRMVLRLLAHAQGDWPPAAPGMQSVRQESIWNLHGPTCAAWPNSCHDAVPWLILAHCTYRQPMQSGGSQLLLQGCHHAVQGNTCHRDLLCER